MRGITRLHTVCIWCSKNERGDRTPLFGIKICSSSFSQLTAMKYLFPPLVIPSVPIQGSDARFPILRIFCVGRNYEAHARELGGEVDREAPFYFTKAAAHYVPSGATVPYAQGTANLHHEMELVVAIGRSGFQIAEGQALAHVFGYACGLDMTRRDLQAALRAKQLPWDMAKDFENAAVVSALVPASAIGHPGKGKIELKVNGDIRQSSDLGLMIHPVPAIITHLSRYYHLQPGDLIFTGTPEGVGPVIVGDRVEGMIERVGEIVLNIGVADSQ
jgi:fumarylpyruvate hydrolase